MYNWYTYICLVYNCNAFYIHVFLKTTSFEVTFGVYDQEIRNTTWIITTSIVKIAAAVEMTKEQKYYLSKLPISVQLINYKVLIKLRYGM